MTIKVLVADDHGAIRAGLVLILRGAEGIEVVGEAADGAAALRMARALRPDVVLMDVRMPGTDGIEATRALVGEGRVRGARAHHVRPRRLRLRGDARGRRSWPRNMAWCPRSSASPITG